MEEASKKQSNSLEKLEKNTLPSIEELTTDVEVTGRRNQLNILLNNEPPKVWLKEHPIAKRKNNEGKYVPTLYLPIEKIEYLLTKIFVDWWPEVQKVQLIGNAVVVTVRVHYKDPLTDKYKWIDGVGAAALNTKEKAGAIDFNELLSSAVMTATPAAKSYAIKDAVEPLGKLFGKDLNRADEISYESLTNSFPESSKMYARNKLSKLIEECQDKYLNKEIMDEVLEAEDNGVNTLQFYNRMISKYEE